MNPRSFFSRAAQVVFPRFCIGCDDNEPDHPSAFCVDCESLTSPTAHFNHKDNTLLERVSVRMDIQSGAALFSFIKGGCIRMAVHRLKYERRPEMGVAFGRLFGQKMRASPYWIRPDFIIPIPSHYVAEALRGYNQAERFAVGISATTGVPVETALLTKSKDIHSQTHKSREDRFQNVRETLLVNHQDRLEDKTILIVDDVMTTGATMEAAYSLLSDIPGIRIQLGLIALAHA